MSDLPAEVQKRLYILRFEDLTARPAACMSHVFEWLGLSPCEIDPDRLIAGTAESDSHYRMKYLHRQSEGIVQPHHHEIPPRIRARIEEVFAWYYQAYYPAR